MRCPKGCTSKRSVLVNYKRIYDFFHLGICHPKECEETELEMMKRKGEKGLEGESGGEGEQGVTGMQGSSGTKGDDGSKGVTGSTGEVGVNGDRGTKGNIGDDGEGGQKGIQGTGGDEGPGGVDGIMGGKGELGEIGNTTTGPKGMTGEEGRKGENGIVGDDGEPGYKGDKGEPGEKGNQGVQGEKGQKGPEGDKGIIGQRVSKISINSTYNSGCNQYEKGQIIYDTVISKFIFCNGTHFQCIPDRPCVGECSDEDPPINNILTDVDTNCVNLIFIIDESASMREEQVWLQNVANQIPIALAQRNYDQGVCENKFGILGFGTGEEKSRAEQIGRPIDLGGVTAQQGQTTITVPYWGTNEDVIRVVNGDPFQGEGRKEDGYAAAYRALQRYTFIGQACRKMLLITDEDRDNETPTPDPHYDRVPSLFNQNMRQVLEQFSITLSAVINIQFQAQENSQPLINADTILGLLPNNSVIYYDPNNAAKISVASGGYVRKDSGAGNTEQTYFEMVRASGGIAWSLPASRTYREAFTNAFLEFEIIPHVAQNDTGSTCKLDTCQTCVCQNGKYECEQIQTIDFNTTVQCRPTECSATQLISGFRQPACVDMVFAVAETETMNEAHIAIKDVAIRLPSNLAAINFGQENSLCPNTYCLMGFGADNQRSDDSCYSYPFPIPPDQKLCAPSSQLAPLIVGLNLTASGEEADGYSSIYTALQTYRDNFQTQSCHHITLITDSERYDCGSYTGDNISVPQLNRELLQNELQLANIVINVIVNATFQDQHGNEAIGIFREIDGSVVAVVLNSQSEPGYVLVPGGAVKQASLGVENDYINLALALDGSAWNIKKMGEQTDVFTRAFVKAVVIKSSESCGQTKACVECKCVGGELQPCEESTNCVVRGEPPVLSYNYGDITITQDDIIALVGGYGSQEEKVFYGLDGDLVSKFTINSRLIQGTQPVNITWYYVNENLENIPIEDSPVASYVSVSDSNPYNLVFSNVGDHIQGTYLIMAENEHGSDTQITAIGIIPKFNGTFTQMAQGGGSVQAGASSGHSQQGQTFVASTGSEVRITGSIREGTRPWNFKWYHNGVELIQGQDYTFELSDTSDQATIIIHDFQSEDAGAYSAVVSSRYGQDTHSFNIIVQTIVSCDNNPLNTGTTCANCQPNRQSKQATLTVYAHSFGSNIQLTWYRISKSSGQREVVSVENIVDGANELAVPVQDLCDYTYEVVVTGLNTYTFQCSCQACVEPDGTTLDCCAANQTLLTKSDCGDEFYADILLLIDVSASMDTEHAFLEAFLPRFEKSLRDNCVGNSIDNQNQYTAVAFGSQQSEGKENPYFVGPNLNKGDSTQNVYFTIDINNPINVTNTIAQLPAIGEREDGYAATNFSITFAQLRDNSIKFAILVTNEFRDFFYRNEEEIAESSTLFNNFTDQGRSLYVDILKSNNIIPIQIIDVALSSGSTQCLGVSSAETCFYRDQATDQIQRLENTEVINTAPNNALKAIHKDYLETALKAGGYVWDLKVIRQNRSGNWDAITNALTSEILSRTTEELTQCRNCQCLPGGRQCTTVPSEDQARCKCEKNFPGNTDYCDCMVQQDQDDDFCRCRYINGRSEAFCQQIGIIDLA